MHAIASVTADIRYAWIENALNSAQMRGFTGLATLARVEFHKPLSFSKNVPVLKVPVCEDDAIDAARKPCLLFDLAADPDQKQPMHDELVREKMMGHMARLMKEADAPAEQYFRLAIPQ